MQYFKRLLSKGLTPYPCAGTFGSPSQETPVSRRVFHSAVRLYSLKVVTEYSSWLFETCCIGRLSHLSIPVPAQKIIVRPGNTSKPINASCFGFLKGNQASYTPTADSAKIVCLVLPLPAAQPDNTAPDPAFANNGNCPNVALAKYEGIAYNNVNKSIVSPSFGLQSRGGKCESVYTKTRRGD